MSWIQIIANRKIEAAMEAGAFDDLPGKGRPLSPETEDRVPPELRAAHRLLRRSGLTPPWIALEKRLRTRLARWRGERTAFVAKWTLLREQVGASPEKSARLDELREAFLVRAAETLAALNREIDRFNLTTPVLSRQRPRRQVAREVERLAAALPRLDGRHGPELWREQLKKKAAAPSRLGNHDYARHRDCAG